MTIRSWLSPLSGFSALIQGLKWLKHPQLRMLIVLPIVINVVIYGLVLGLGLHWTDGLMADLIAWLPDWLSFLGTLFWWLMLFMLLAVLGLTFVTAALIVGAPFYGQLSARTLSLLGVTASEASASDPLSIALLIPKGIGREFSKLVSFLPLLVLVVVISLLPGINVIAPFVWLSVNSWIFGLQFLDYPFDDAQKPFGAVKDWGRRHRGAVLGFGFAIVIGSSIPVLNLLIIPAAVVGATRLWVQIDRAENGAR